MAGERQTRAGRLPQTDAYVELSLLDGGSFIGDLSKVHAGAAGKYRMYNWAFHITHHGRHFLWDLGLDDVRCDLLLNNDASTSLICNLVGPFELHTMGEQIHVR
jgi:hypothetical protein